MTVGVFSGMGYAVLSITDDDTARATAAAANPLEVDEGGTAACTVVLDSQPTGDVSVTPASGDAGAVSVSPSSRTFKPSAWNTPQTFTVNR